VIPHSPALAPERDTRSAWLSPASLLVEHHFNVDDGLDRRGEMLAVRSALREAATAAAAAAARAVSLAELLDEALAVMTDAEITTVGVPTPLDASQHRADALSPREREVLALVAEGRSNKAIAAVLFVSPNTIKTHVTSLLHKLHADSRVQLAAMATTHGLHHSAETSAAIDPGSI
jgi:DNA-binding NarL/FixJ family response regulator